MTAKLNKTRPANRSAPSPAKTPPRKPRLPTSEASSTTDAVLQFIKDGIRTGRFAPGQRLRERELVEGCSVSRSAVREALRTLAADGTIIIEHRRSAVVRQFTREEVWAQHQIREVLEGLAASLAAGRATVSGSGQDLLTLEREMTQAMTRVDVPHYWRLNIELHRLIVRMSGNASIQEHLDRAMTTQVRLQAARFMDETWMQRSHAEHTAIVYAILSGDSSEAEAAMRRHIRGTRRGVLEMPEHIFDAPRPNDRPPRSVGLAQSRNTTVFAPFTIIRSSK
jgi:DNA-binding GntR family transcriptional regulator